MTIAAPAGSHMIYERAHSPHMVNIPRALFHSCTGRQLLYHGGIEELQDRAYAGERLVPLKGFPGVVWERSGKKKRLDRSTSVLMSIVHGGDRGDHMGAILSSH